MALRFSSYCFRTSRCAVPRRCHCTTVRESPCIRHRLAILCCVMYTVCVVKVFGHDSCLGQDGLDGRGWSPPVDESNHVVGPRCVDGRGKVCVFGTNHSFPSHGSLMKRARALAHAGHSSRLAHSSAPAQYCPSGKHTRSSAPLRTAFITCQMVSTR